MSRATERIMCVVCGCIITRLWVSAEPGMTFALAVSLAFAVWLLPD